MKFEFDRLAGTLRPFKNLKSTMMPMGQGAKPTRVTEVQLEMELIVEKDDFKKISWLFSDIDLKKVGQTIAGDDSRGGLKMTANTNLPPMNFKLFHDDKEVFDRTDCKVKAKPVLQFMENGDAKLLIKPKVKLVDKEMVQVLSIIDADVKVSTEKTQVDMSEETKLAQAA